MGDEETDGKRLSGAEESDKNEAEEQKKVSTEEEPTKTRASSIAKSATRIKSSKSIGALKGASLSRMKMRKHSFGFGGVPGIKPVENVQMALVTNYNMTLNDNRGILSLCQELCPGADFQSTPHYPILLNKDSGQKVNFKIMKVAPEFRRPQLVYLPTYQLEPSVRFHVAKVTAATNESLDDHFDGHKYNEQETPALSMKIAGEVMRKVKAMQFNRYRVITVVTIGQKRAQSYSNAITFLWDHERDSYVDLQRENNSAFIQITTFGIYLD